MEQQLDQLVQAINIASDARQANLHQDALRFISTFENDHVNGWRAGLTLFTMSDGNGTRKHSPQVRFFGLRLLESFLEAKYEPLDNDTFQFLKAELLDYIRSEYLLGNAETNSVCESSIFQSEFLANIDSQSFGINSRIYSLYSSCAHISSNGQPSSPTSSSSSALKILNRHPLPPDLILTCPYYSFISSSRFLAKLQTRC